MTGFFGSFKKGADKEQDVIKVKSRIKAVQKETNELYYRLGEAAFRSADPAVKAAFAPQIEKIEGNYALLTELHMQLAEGNKALSEDEYNKLLDE